MRDEGAGDARGSGVGAGDDLLGVRGGHPELGHAQVGREGGSGEQHRSPRVGEIILDILGSDLTKGSDGASRGGPLGAEGRLGAARGERGSGLGDGEHDISGPSVGGRVGWCDAAMHNEIDSKCRAGTSRAFSSHELPSAKHPCIGQNSKYPASAFYAVLTNRYLTRQIMRSSLANRIGKFTFCDPKYLRRYQVRECVCF